MQIRLASLAVVAVTGSVLLAGTHGAAQAKVVKDQAPVVTAAPSTPAPSEKDVAILQKDLIELLRQTPKLTMVVARDPSLLANKEYVQRYNPRLADFLTAHPDVAKNPDYYLFDHLNRDGAGTDDVLERAVWPEMYSGRRERTAWDELVSDIPPTIGIGSFLLAFLWILRLFVDNRRWSRIFSLQNQVHGKLIDKFSSSQELAAYMETEAGKRFLEAAPIPVGIDSGQRVPNAVARVLTPIQIGIVLVLLGIGFLMLRHSGPDMETPMLVLGTVVLMPGIGFIISAGITWVLATRLGLMPPREEPATPANRFNAPFGNSDRS